MIYNNLKRGNLKGKEINNLIINKKEIKFWKMSYLSPYYYSRYYSPYYRSSYYYPYSYLDYPYYPRSYYYDYPLTRTVDVVTTTTTTEVPVYTPSYYYPRSYYYPSYRYYSPYLERSYYTTYIWAFSWVFVDLKWHL